jgi:hypothetical protein
MFTAAKLQQYLLETRGGAKKIGGEGDVTKLFL